MTFNPHKKNAADDSTFNPFTRDKDDSSQFETSRANTLIRQYYSKDKNVVRYDNTDATSSKTLVKYHHIGLRYMWIYGILD